MNIEEITDTLSSLVLVWGLQIIFALLTLIIGLWLAKKISGFLKSRMDTRGVDATISQFVAKLVYVLIVAFVIIAVLGKVGVETTSLIAIMGAAGLAVGLALQGSLSNFASGVLLIIFRPIRAGDFVEAAGVSGVVEEVSMFSTRLVTGDNKLVILPNTAVASGAIVNYSAKPERRVDLMIGVSYDANLAEVKAVLNGVVEADERVLQDKGITVAVHTLADSSVNLVVRAWVKTGDYWPVYFSLTENVKVKLDEAGIGIPYPQVDVHMAKAD
ncbi:MAG: mechanosensitive ion channel domain-containing protein [Pseudomonadales bacterium]